MGQVVIECPKTGQWIPTGIDMPRESFEASSFDNNTIQCSACGESHTWSKADAKVVD
jgi:hypothetical protein